MCTSPIADSGCFEIHYGCSNCETCSENAWCDIKMDDIVKDMRKED